MVLRQQPRLEAILRVDIVHACRLWRLEFFWVHNSCRNYLLVGGEAVAVPGTCAFGVDPGVIDDDVDTGDGAFVTCSDLINDMIWINCSGVTCPWNVGMIGPNPDTSFA